MRHFRTWTSRLLILGTVAFWAVSCSKGGIRKVDRVRSTASAENSKEYCTSTREYVTAMQYIRNHAEFSLNEAQIQELSEKISKQCTGAAERFIRVSTLLLKSNVGSKDAIKAGLEFAERTDAQTDGFITVFRMSYLKEYLDMDAYSSMTLARTVAADYRGDVDQAREDFARLVTFCTSEDGLDLPRPQCGQMAARITQAGVDFEAGVAGDFVELFRFATSKNGPALTTGDALQLAEVTIGKGPTAANNFRDAYRYAVSSAGLQLATGDALKFAEKMATTSYARNTGGQAGERIPASSKLNR